MRYTKIRNVGTGEWHCPYKPEWVARMRHAAEICKYLSAENIEAVLNGEVLHYRVKAGEFLSHPQDSRGLPMWYAEQRWQDGCTATYDYESIPEVVVTNGIYDWPLEYRCGVLTA